MAGRGVIVEYSSFTEEGDSAKDKLSCSGVYLSNGWILTHGTIVIDLLREKNARLLLEELKTKCCAVNERKSLFRALLDSAQSKFQIIFDERNYRDLMSSGLPYTSHESDSEINTIRHSKSLHSKDLSHYNKVTGSKLHLPLALSAETPSYFRHPASVFMVFVQPGIIKSLEAMMPASQGWKFTEDGEGEKLDVDLEAVTISSFALLKVFPFTCNVNEALSEITTEELIHLVEKMSSVAEVVNKGTPVYVESAPFGSLSPSVFLNSLSKGIISNVCGSEGDVYLTDARCVMGAEGAPVYAVADGKVNVCGMVISSFCWKQGEWLGISLLAAARPLLFSLLCCVRCLSDEKVRGSVKLRKLREVSTIDQIHDQRKFNEELHISKHSLDMPFKDIAETLDNVVVGVSCGGGWGSGIVVNTSPGIILTCAHVVQPANYGEVVVITSDGTRIPGQVIYHTRPNSFFQGAKSHEKEAAAIWDVAVVHTSHSFTFSLPLATQLPPKGSPVVVAGHGVFSPKEFPSPSISHGVISKIVSIDLDSISYSAVIGDERELKTLNKHDSCVENDNFHIKANTHLKRPLEKYSRKSDILPMLIDCDCKNANLEVSDKIQSTYGKVLLGCDENGLVPVMLQTTCSVYAGNSGGPVVSVHPQYGLQVAGVMVCNTKDLTNKATFPHINLAVPAPAIRNIIMAYMSSGDKAVLAWLGVQCATVSRLWALGLTPQSHL